MSKNSVCDKEQPMNEQQMNPIRSVQARLVRSLRRGIPAVAAFACFSMALTPAQAQYQRTGLVSNQAGAAPLQDPNLINGWGLVSLPGSPYWVSDNGTGLSTLYTAAGARIPLVVAVPPLPASLPGTLGTPTGIVGNISPNASYFTVKGNGKSGRAFFI